MDKEIKDKWVTALRSGEYTQGKDWLASEGCNCCLGVLAEIQGVEEGEEERFIDTYYTPFIINGIHCDGILPDGYLGLNEDTQMELAAMNDKGIPFDVIADFIEENL